jgi:hypothetical protein
VFPSWNVPNLGPTLGGKVLLEKLPDLSHDLLLKLIDNEINSALMFVAVARNAYRAARFSEGNFALSKAEAIHVQASELAQGAKKEQKEMISSRLAELKSAIDWLMTGNFLH